MEIFYLSGAEIPTDHNASSNGKSIKKEYHDVDDHGRGTDCCQSLFTDKVADNDGVHRVVEHLKNIAEKKRYRKSNQVAYDRALRHIPDSRLR